MSYALASEVQEVRKHLTCVSNYVGIILIVDWDLKKNCNSNTSRFIFMREITIGIV